MNSRLNPYITFNGNARAALKFYEEVFGGTLTVHTFGDFGAGDGPGADNVMHGQLETTSGFTLMGSDTPPGMEHSPGNTMTVSLSGDDAEELRGYWTSCRPPAPSRCLRAADVGGRVRDVHRPVRRPLDGQHRPAVHDRLRIAAAAETLDTRSR